MKRFKKYQILFFVILFLGFFIKLIYAYKMRGFMYDFGDAGDYDKIAMRLLLEHKDPVTSVFPCWRPPLFPLFLAFLYMFSPQNFLLLEIAQIILMTLSGLFLFKLAKQLFSQQVAIISLAIFSFHPYFIKMIAGVQNETLFLFFSLISLYFFLKFVDLNRFVLLFLSGVLSGAAILTRPTFLIFFPVSIFWLCVFKKNIKFVFKSSLTLIFSCLLVLSPWIIRNFILFKEFIFCNNAAGYYFFLANSRENYEVLTTRDISRFKYLSFQGSVVEKTAIQLKKFEKDFGYSKLSPKSQEKLWYAASFDYIKNNKDIFFKLLFLKTIDYLRPWLNPLSYENKYVIASALINIPIFLFAIIGMLVALTSSKLRDKTIFFILFFLAGIILHIFYLAMNRYRIVCMDPYLYLFAAFAFIGLLKRKKK